MIWLTIKRHILSTWDKRPQNFPKDHIQDQRTAGRAKQYGGSQRNSDAAGKLMMSEQFVVYCAINIGGDTKNKSIKTFQYSFSLQCSWALWKKGTLKVRCSASHPVLTQWEGIRETIPVVDHVSEEHSGCLHWRGQWLPSLTRPAKETPVVLLCLSEWIRQEGSSLRTIKLRRTIARNKLSSDRGPTVMTALWKRNSLIMW